MDTKCVKLANIAALSANYWGSWWLGQNFEGALAPQAPRSRRVWAGLVVSSYKTWCWRFLRFAVLS